jgi:hypothetical protein
MFTAFFSLLYTKRSLSKKKVMRIYFKKLILLFLPVIALFAGSGNVAAQDTAVSQTEVQIVTDVWAFATKTKPNTANKNKIAIICFKNFTTFTSFLIFRFALNSKLKTVDFNT